MNCKIGYVEVMFLGRLEPLFFAHTDQCSALLADQNSYGDVWLRHAKSRLFYEISAECRDLHQQKSGEFVQLCLDVLSDLRCTVFNRTYRWFSNPAAMLLIQKKKTFQLSSLFVAIAALVFLGSLEREEVEWYVVYVQRSPVSPQPLRLVVRVRPEVEFKARLGTSPCTCTRTMQNSSNLP